jgi:mannose/fructose/N-acetylgalactosamine-specific phosphotransferase system component IID
MVLRSLGRRGSVGGAVATVLLFLLLFAVVVWFVVPYYLASHGFP